MQDIKPYDGKISSILLDHGAITNEALADAEEAARNKGMRLEKYLVEMKLVNARQMTLAVARYLNMPPITLSHFSPDPALLSLLPKDVMSKRLAIPVTQYGKTLTLALGDPFDLMAVDEVSTLTGLEVIPVVAPENEIGDALGKVFAKVSQGLDMEALMREDEGGDVEVVEGEDEELSLDEMLESAVGAPVIRMVNMILVEALRTGASDIHIEPMEKRLRLRYRIDGALVERPGPPKNLQAAVISRIKIMSDLDIAERRVPQDGRFNIKAMGKQVDLRVSILPTSHGEKVVMRILDKASLASGLADLGLDKTSEQAMNYAIHQPHGIILVTGPTGSGKTTTLYAGLRELNSIEKNIVTIEDPVEYQFEIINQNQVREEIGLSFARILRHVLRQDPDIVMVGEIRDAETAEIAVQAALTGHLVLSTMHTNDAASSVSRLLEMGIEAYLLASALIGVVSQRLVRTICPDCATEYYPSPAELESLGVPEEKSLRLHRGQGCSACFDSGYRGRIGIYELLLVDADLRCLLLDQPTNDRLRRHQADRDMASLRSEGLRRVLEGATTLEEVGRAAHVE